MASVYAQRRFVHMGINVVGNAVQRGLTLPIDVSLLHTRVESYLATGVDDWYRYAAQNYVLWTNRPVVDVANELCKVSGLEHIYVFLVEFAPAPPEANGMMPKAFWEWLRKPRLT